jgi:L-iditol 2-dehydrogenase
MRALVKTKEKVELKTNVMDEPLKNGFIKINVKQVGLCRTDLFVASGAIKVAGDIVLGHEFSGVVLEDSTDQFEIGQSVAVNPFFGIGNFMGLNFDGCLRDIIQVPAQYVIKVANNIDFKKAAYLEPLAASLAVLKACKDKTEKGAIFGKNRIAELTYLIMKTEGYNVEWLDEKLDYEENSFDYVVETLFEESYLNKIIKILKPEGTLVVKSRKQTGVPIISALLVAKELTFRCVNYYDFGKSMDWLSNNSNVVDGLLGESYSINDWEIAFDAANNSEKKKIFINLD